MFQSYLNKKWVQKLGFLVGLVGGLIGISYLVGFVLRFIFGLLYQHNLFSIKSVNENVMSTVLAAVVYILTLIMFKRLVELMVGKLSAKELGMSRMPVWSDIFLAPIAFIVYFILSGVFLTAISFILPSVDLSQTQEVGFSNLGYNYEFLVAFVTLVILAPVLEEVLFRGYLIGALKTKFKAWQVVLISALTFGFMHGAVNVGVDTFALGLLLAILRINTGSIWSSILLHSLKNNLAFYLVFINPTILNTIGG